MFHHTQLNSVSPCIGKDEVSLASFHWGFSEPKIESWKLPKLSRDRSLHSEEIMPFFDLKDRNHVKRADCNNRLAVKVRNWEHVCRVEALQNDSRLLWALADSEFLGFVRKHAVFEHNQAYKSSLVTHRDEIVLVRNEIDVENWGF